MTARTQRAFRKGWGADLVEGGAAFRLWAPGQSRLTLRCDGQDHPMDPEADGWFALTVSGVGAGTEYGFVLEDGSMVPDPAARAQAGDVHGASVLTDPRAFDWSPWHGRPWAEAVILELHVGTFTPQGTFQAIIEKLPHLVETGITAIEIMPVAQFAGNRGWGYDGVLPYAPHPAYGSPDDLKALIDACHRHGVMVLLDVVYNHFGPEGSYLPSYAPDFFNAGRNTPWGAAIDFSRAPVRQFFVENALYWMEEFHLDGLRLDAVDHLHDTSDIDILIEIAQAVRARFPGAHLTTEDNRNITSLHMRDPQGRPPLYSAEWNDDFHNVAHVIATGESEGYYVDFVEERWVKFARALAQGYVWQGEVMPATGLAHGEPSGHLPPLAFVDFLQNHDQTGNRAFGERLLALSSEQMVRALMTIHLLSPHVPLLFMGEEFGETQPFAFFTDFHGDLAQAVRAGRQREFAKFGAFLESETRAAIPDPNDPATFTASRIDWHHAASAKGRDWLAFTRGLLDLRRRWVTPHLAGAKGHAGQVVLAEDALIAVDWQLDGARLQLRANLSDHPADLPPATGTCVAGQPGELAALSVALWSEPLA